MDKRGQVVQFQPVNEAANHNKEVLNFFRQQLEKVCIKRFKVVEKEDVDEVLKNSIFMC